MITLFTYGTLQKPEVQKKIIGRVLEVKPDTLTDYKKGEVLINEKTYLIADCSEGQHIDGVTVEVTKDELHLMDDYETKAYKRVRLVLKSGRSAWVYARP